MKNKNHKHDHIVACVSVRRCRRRPSVSRTVSLIVASIVIALTVLTACTSCTTKKYVAVPVPEYHSDTIRLTTHQRDSIFLHDSVFVRQYQRSDTVYLVTERWHTAYRDRLHHDTAYISRRDTIGIPYPVERRVTERTAIPLTKFQQLRLWIGNIVLAVVAICLLWWIISRWRNR